MAGETTEVLMPLMGEGITEATLVKWLKKPGEAVKKEEPLLEVSTDKVDTEIPSPASGFLVETFASDGDTVEINKVIAIVAAEAGQAKAAAGGADVAGEALRGKSAEAGGRPSAAPASPQPGRSGAAARVESPAAPGPSQAASTRGSSPSPQAKAPGAESGTAARTTRSSPLVRKMARSHNIDLGQVQGSGLHGRITKRDLEAFQSGGSQPSQTPAASQAPALVRGPAHLEYGRLDTKRDGAGIETLDGVPVRREKMSKMRALIAEHMVRSVRTSAHVTTIFEIDMHRVVKAREKHRAAFAAREGFNLTFTPFFVHAAVQAIKRHPVVNVSVDGEEILWKDQINVGVAVAIETGLIVPVVRNAGELNLLGIARRVNDLATRARSKKLVPDDVQGGTFSITNPGMFGSIVSAPIINQPQVAILSIGAIVKRPVVIDDLIGVRPLVQVGLTFDHRVVDGEGGAKYLATLKELLEGFDETSLV